MVHPDAGPVQPGGEPFQRVAVGDLPAIEDGAVGAALVHQDALLAVVHAEGQGRGGGVGHLQPHDARAECAPFVEAGGFHPDIAQAFSMIGLSFKKLAWNGRRHR